MKNGYTNRQHGICPVHVVSQTTGNEQTLFKDPWCSFRVLMTAFLLHRVSQSGLIIDDETPNRRQPTTTSEHLYTKCYLLRFKQLISP
jgi:hypothetical protein